MRKKDSAIGSPATAMRSRLAITPLKRAPAGMTAAQVAYWESIFQRLVDTPDWKAEMVTLNGLSEFMGAARLKKFMEEDYAEIKAFLVELELAKK